ncbi:MAG: sensor histidine kinase [Solirubrobacteraceae bacterium]
MARRLFPRGLRGQLAVAIALVTLLAVGATFLALYSGTSSRLRAQIDAQLRTQAAEWRVFTAHKRLRPPARLKRAARQFIAAQRYHAEALIIAVQVVGRRAPVSNNTELVARERLDEGSRESTGLLNSPDGLANASVEEAGPMRVLALPIRSGGRRVGTLRVANPLTPLLQAQASLRRTFIVVAIVALAVAIAAGIGLASLIAAPLRRIARVAAAVDAGDLSLRSGPVAASGEVRVLSEAFDRMLDRLERAFKRQRDFVSDASHELRTPLSVLRAQVELLDRAPETTNRHEATATLLRRLDELDRLVGDMLTLASAEAGQLIEPHTMELDGFFEDVRRDLPLFGDREFQLESTGGTLKGDPDRLTQVMRNLVRNAVAHTAPGDRVTVTSRPFDGRLEICVSDSGPGIPPDQLEEIFERFHRLDHGRDRGGSGLGLAIARAIVEAHGGSIRAESAPGQGATFRVELPGYSP